MPPSQLITANGFDGSALGVPNFLGEVGILAEQIFSAEEFGTPDIEVGDGTVFVVAIQSAEAFGLPSLGTPPAPILIDSNRFNVVQARAERQRVAAPHVATSARYAEPARLQAVSATRFASVSAPRTRANLSQPGLRATVATGGRERAGCVFVSIATGDARAAGSVQAQVSQATTVSRAVSGGLLRATYSGV